MKLRQLTLTNVRRFGGQTATLGPFGDGLSTVTAENEAGKSTFFDALHALFFISHTSKAAEVRALQPYSGGAVSVAADIEIDGQAYRIEKTFLSQPLARITDAATGQVIKQQGDAEHWIEGHINSIHKGLAGLLWVRQGEAHIDREGRGKDADNIAARRDLMSSVRGQIDAVTGGRRMDRIMEACRSDFERLSTQTFKAKVGSPWKTVEEQVAALRTEQEALATKVAQLSQALKLKTRITKRLRALQDPEARALRKAQIATATEALEHAKTHAAKVTQAAQKVQAAEHEAAQIARDINDIRQAQTRRQQLNKKLERTRTEVDQAAAARAEAEQALTALKADIQTKEAERQTLFDATLRARAAQKTAQDWQHLHRLAGVLSKLDGPQSRLEAAHTVLDGSPITAADIDRMMELNQRINIATKQRQALFASFTLAPSGGGKAELNGQTVPPTEPQLIDRPLTLHIENYGALHLSPAQAASAEVDDPDALRAELTQLLQERSFETLQQARDAFAARQRAQGNAELALAEIRGLAPDGAPAVQAEFDAVCASLDHPTDAPLPEAETPQAVSETQTTFTQLEQELAALKPKATDLQAAFTQATTAKATASGLLEHLAEEQRAQVCPEGETDQLIALEKQAEDIAQRMDEARVNLKTLQSDGPDLAAAQSTFDRLQSADQADRDETETLRRELARVDGAIEAQAEAAVEEKLAAVSETLDKARTRAQRYEKQARALKLLIDHLDAARKDAQETYFEPIRTELHPLLAQLHGGAAFELDPDKMLVDKITRNGVTDAVSVLSGGAYEQVAILTRLAFARLFAREGRHMPVILDDALVHTDDERIGTMFNMLTQAAKDQQIIVLSCRTRAFSDLGGTRTSIQITSD